MGRNKNIKTNTTTATTNNGGGSNNSTPVKIPKESKLQAKKLKGGDKYKTPKLTKSKLKKSKLEVQSNTEALLKFREKFITNLSNCIHQFEQDCLHDYQYKLKEIDTQLKLIHDNPSKVFSEKYEQIGQLRDYKIYRDELDKNYKLREIEEEYKNILIKAEKNYQNENETVRKRLLGYVQDKRTRLRDEMNNMEISEEYTVEIPNRNHPQTRRSKRKEEELTISYNKVPKVELNPKLFTLRQDQVSEDFDIFYNGNGQQMLGKRRNLRNGKKQ